jgi:hypothetical protein
MEVSDQLHAPAALLPVKELTCTHWIEAGWAPEPFWTRGEEKNYRPPP